MRFVDEYRNEADARKLLTAIERTVTRPWMIMEICGGQTHTLIKSGIDRMLPPEITLVHGPGCPVCVTPLELIDKAIAIARRPEVILTSFGDMLRVPGSGIDLLGVRAQGGDVRMVYSPLDAVKLAQAHPDRQVVFFAVGFETTAPGNAMAVWQAQQLGLNNFSILCSHVLVPPAMEAILGAPGNQVQGFLAAGHVCTVMGFWEYEPIAAQYRVPIVVTGFEPLDLLQGIYHDDPGAGGRSLGRGEPVHAPGDARRESASPTPAEPGLRGVRPGLARHRHDPSQRLPPPPGVRRVRRRAALWRRKCPRRGIAALHRRADPARGEEAARVQRVRAPVYARTPPGRADGLVGRRLRGVLQLRKDDGGARDSGLGTTD